MISKVGLTAMAVMVTCFLGGYILGTQLDTTRDTSTQLDTFNISNESQMSPYEAEVFIDGAIQNHQFYINHPDLQTAQTGDTAFNQEVNNQYRRLKELIKRMVYP